MKVKRLKIALVIAIGLGVVVLGAVVYAQSTNVLAVGTIPHSELFDGPATVTVRTLTINPGNSLAWHYHPGYAFNVVKSGALTVEDGCGGEETLLATDTSNNAFEEMDGRVHRAKNLTSEPVLVYNTFIVPQGKPTTVNIRVTSMWSAGRRERMQGRGLVEVYSPAQLHGSGRLRSVRASPTTKHNSGPRGSFELSHRVAREIPLPRRQMNGRPKRLIGIKKEKDHERHSGFCKDGFAFGGVDQARPRVVSTHRAGIRHHLINHGQG